MKKNSIFFKLLITTALMLAAGESLASESHTSESHINELRIVVASNFADAITTLSERFETNTGYKVILIFGSTGKFYAQIKHGAPFDAFFAADVHRPALLEQEGLVLPGSRFTYAIGKVVLWSPKPDQVDREGLVLAHGNFRYLAIANPKLAPYGKAAREVLLARGHWETLRGRLVRGQNIGQAFQFVKSGNAELGFVAYSQVKRPNQSIEGSYWEVPQALYVPIEQQAVLLKDSEAARAFLLFVKSNEALKIIRDYGYDTP